MEDKVLERLLSKKILNLEKVIDTRDEDEEWLNTNRDSVDTNEYFWRHCGERDLYQGRLEALKELLETLQKPNQEVH